MTQGQNWLFIGIVGGLAITMLAGLTVGCWKVDREWRERERAREVASLNARIDRVTEELEKSEARLTARIGLVESRANRRIEQVNDRVTAYR